MNFHNPIAKTALRKFPRKSGCKSKLSQGVPELLPPITFHLSTCPALHTHFFNLAAHRAGQPPPGPASKASQVLPCLKPGASQGPGREQGTSTQICILQGFPRQLYQAPSPLTSPAQASLTARQDFRDWRSSLPTAPREPFVAFLLLQPCLTVHGINFKRQ